MELSMDTLFRVLAACATIWMVSGFLQRVVKSLWIGYRLRHLPGPRSSSILGNVQERQRRDRHRLFAEYADKYGPILHTRILLTHMIHVTDPALIAEALRNRAIDKRPQNAGGLNAFASPHNIPMLLTAESNERWKGVRKAAASAFSTSNMKAEFPNIRAACSQLVEVLKKVSPEDVVDIDSALCRESLDVIGRVGFGRDMGATRALTGDASGHAIEATAAGMLEADRRITDPLRKYQIWRRDVRAGGQAMRRFHAVMQDLLAGMRRERPAESSIAAHLLDITDPDTGKPLDDKHILPEISILFMAGFETTGHTAAWFVYCMTQHPEAEAKLVAELREHGLLATPEQQTPRPIQWDDIPKLTYLQAALKETMRMYPAGGVASFRFAKEDVVLGGGRLVAPAGAGLHMPITAVHHSPAVWEDPMVFNPERFFKEGVEDAVGAPKVNGRTPPRFMPFAQGNRDCVGQTLARLNLSTTLPQLYGNFTFCLAKEMGGPQGVEASEVTSITLSCANGMKVHCIPRVPKR